MYTYKNHQEVEKSKTYYDIFPSREVIKCSLGSTYMYIGIECSGHSFQNANIVGILKYMTRAHHLWALMIYNGNHILEKLWKTTAKCLRLNWMQSVKGARRQNQSAIYGLQICFL